VLGEGEGDLNELEAFNDVPNGRAPGTLEDEVFKSPGRLL